MADPLVTDPVPPPPGTEEQSFFQRSGTQTAIVSTVALGLLVLRAAIMGAPVSPEALSVALEAVVWAWVGAVGIHAVGPGSLKRTP